MSLRLSLRSTAAAAAVLPGLLVAAACSPSTGPEPGPPGTTRQPSSSYVVSLGDSYISGEGARWAGNTDGDSRLVDALGPLAYFGPIGLEAIPGCHRASLPEVAVDSGDLLGKNLACSGAETSSQMQGLLFKPGIDFYAQGDRIGQALALQRFASKHEVRAVVLSIGGNDSNFATILTTCVTDFVVSVGQPRPLSCSKDASLASYFAPPYVADVAQRIRGAVDNITMAMSRAGHDPSTYRVIVQNYPSLVPSGRGFRYPETASGRLALGGCPLFGRDATWANDVALKTINDTLRRAVRGGLQDNVTFLDLSSAFLGHRLCERGAAQLQESGLSSWEAPGAANALEWVNATYLKGPPWQPQESAHPNYWGTAAERNCLRQVVTQTRTRSASVSCVRDGTAMAAGEPAMKLVGD